MQNLVAIRCLENENCLLFVSVYARVVRSFDVIYDGTKGVMYGAYVKILDTIFLEVCSP